MSRAKTVFKHIAIFILTLLILWVGLILSALIPNALIKDNMTESALSYREKPEFSYESARPLYSVADNYADTILLGVSWNMGNGSPLISSVNTAYNDGSDYGENAGLYLSVTQNDPPNTDYTRYWHGSAMFIRPLHLFMSVSGIKMLGFVTAVILALVCAVLLVRRRQLAIAVAFILSLTAVQIWNIRLSLEYQPSFIISLIMCILFLSYDGKSTCLSVIGGIATAFFDFLTTETITILLPLMLITAVRARENRRCDFKFLLTCVALWGASYACTFIAKWSIASLITGENKFVPALFYAGERVNGITDNVAKSPISLMLLAPFANISTLFGGTVRVDFPRAITGIVICSMVVISVLYLLKKEAKNIGVYKHLAFLGSIVFVRFVILGNHSYLHEFFTYRALVAPIFAILSGIVIACGAKKGADK